MNVIVSVQPPRALLLPLRQLGCSHVVGGMSAAGNSGGHVPFSPALCLSVGRCFTRPVAC